MRSDRHNSGFALRFPRILRIRTDKSPQDIDTLERVEEIYAMQQPKGIGGYEKSRNREPGADSAA
jgi:DNA ligase-1